KRAMSEFQRLHPLPFVVVVPHQAAGDPNFLRLKTGDVSTRDEAFSWHGFCGGKTGTSAPFPQLVSSNIMILSAMTSRVVALLFLTLCPGLLVLSARPIADTPSPPPASVPNISYEKY